VLSEIKDKIKLLLIKGKHISIFLKDVEKETFQKNIFNKPPSIETKMVKSHQTLEDLLSEPLPSNKNNEVYQNEDKLIVDQLEQMKSQLSKAKIQIEHLNELLNESELNSSRSCEQINLLKQEIRR
jgi:hypothetical protein